MIINRIQREVGWGKQLHLAQSPGREAACLDGSCSRDCEEIVRGIERVAAANVGIFRGGRGRSHRWAIAVGESKSQEQ